MDPNAVAAIREEMERAQARRLQPHFIGAFFREAFTLLGGRIAERERGRFEIRASPPILKDRDRLIGRGDPVLDRYARVTFDKARVVGKPQAELLAPGHPLLDAAGGRGAGAVPAAAAARARCWWTMPMRARTRGCWSISNMPIRDGRTVRSGEPRVISQRLQFIHLRRTVRPSMAARPPIWIIARSRRRNGRWSPTRSTAPWLAGRGRAARAGLRHRQPGARSIWPK